MLRLVMAYSRLLPCAAVRVAQISGGHGAMGPWGMEIAQLSNVFAGQDIENDPAPIRTRHRREGEGGGEGRGCGLHQQHRTQAAGNLSRDLHADALRWRLAPQSLSRASTRESRFIT